jgi:hypothetical protein
LGRGFRDEISWRAAPVFECGSKCVIKCEPEWWRSEPAFAKATARQAPRLLNKPDRHWITIKLAVARLD